MTTAFRPPKSYPLSLFALMDMANAVSELDGLVQDKHRKALVQMCHFHIVRTLGPDVDLIYGPDEEAA